MRRWKPGRCGCSTSTSRRSTSPSAYITGIIFEEASYAIGDVTIQDGRYGDARMLAKAVSKQHDLLHHEDVIRMVHQWFSEQPIGCDRNELHWLMQALRDRRVTILADRLEIGNGTETVEEMDNPQLSLDTLVAILRHKAESANR